ncbi:acyl carrier protein [Bacteroidota bacterium]
MDNIELDIQKIMADVFETTVDTITLDSTQDSVENWDSLKHLDLVVSIEEKFMITIPIEEVGDLVSFKLISVIVKEQLAS